MAKIQSFRDLEAWRRAMDLAVACYAVAKALPPDERFGLSAQLRRAASSIPANIAEGQARQGKREFLHHLSIARGSLAEVDTHLELAERLGYISPGDLGGCRELIGHTGRILSGLARAVEASDGRRPLAEDPAPWDTDH